MTKTLKCDVLVVGTGIIGSMAALYLQNDGRDVVLLERGDISRGASSGNAGILAFPEIIPIPAPGIMKKPRAGFLIRSDLSACRRPMHRRSPRGFGVSGAPAPNAVSVMG